MNLTRSRSVLMLVFALFTVSCGGTDDTKLIDDKPTVDLANANRPGESYPNSYNDNQDNSQQGNATDSGFNQGTVGNDRMSRNTPFVIQSHDNRQAPSQLSLGQSVPFYVRVQQQGQQISRYIVICQLLKEQQGKLVAIVTKECQQDSGKNSYAYNIQQADFTNTNIQTATNAPLMGRISVVAPDPQSSEANSLIEVADSVVWRMTLVGGVQQGSTSYGNTVSINRPASGQNQVGYPFNQNRPQPQSYNPNVGLSQFSQSVFPGNLDNKLNGLGIDPQIASAVLSQLLKGSLSGRGAGGGLIGGLLNGF